MLDFRVIVLVLMSVLIRGLFGVNLTMCSVMDFVEVFICLDIAVMLWMLFAFRRSVTFLMNWTNNCVLMPVHISHWWSIGMVYLTSMFVIFLLFLHLSRFIGLLFILFLVFFLIFILIFISIFILIFIFILVLLNFMLFLLFLSKRITFFSSTKFMISILEAVLLDFFCLRMII